MKTKELNITRIVKDRLRKPSKEALAIILIMVFGIVIPLTWFKDGYLFAMGDFFPPLDPYNTIKSSGFIWAQRGAGQPSFLDPPTVFPFYVFWGIFQFLGFSSLATEKLWFIFLFLGSGLSMYYLASVLLPEKKNDIAKLTAAVFYMVSPAIAPIGGFFQVGNILGYAFTPLILGLFITGLKKRKIKYAIFIAISSLFLLGGAMSSVVVSATILMLAGIYFIFHIITTGRKEILSDLLFLGKTIALSILINLWWLPSVIVPFTSSSSAVATQAMDIGSISAASQHSSLLEVFRLLGRPTFLDGWRGQPYFPFAASYYTPALIIATYLIPIMAFSALLLKRNDKGVLFLAITALISIFLAKGLHPPLEFVNIAMYTYIPWFTIFRRPVGKFNLITALCYAPLIGVTVKEIYTYLWKKNGRIYVRNHFSNPLWYKGLSMTGRVMFVIAVSSVIFASGWPMLTGDMLLPDRGKLGKSYVKVPSYWLECAKWINDQEGDFRVLLYPEPHQFGIMYSWGYDGADIARRLIYKPYLANYGIFAESTLETSGAFDLTALVDKAIESGETANLLNLLAILNVKYILHRKDLDWDKYALLGWDIDQPQHTTSVLNSQKGIHFERNFGELDLYRVDDEYFTPHIYTTDNATYAYGKIDSLASRNFGLPSVIFLSKDTQKNFILTKGGVLYIDVPKGNISSDSITYNITIPEAGNYDIYLKAIPNLIEESLKVKIDGRTFDAKGYISQGIYSLSDIALSKGIHTVSIPTRRAILKDPGFEKGVWGGAIDVTPVAPGVSKFSAEQSTDAYEGSYSINLTTYNHQVAVRQIASDFVPNAVYSLSFEYKHISGAAPAVAVLEIDQFGRAKKVLLDEPSLPYEEGKWMHYAGPFTSDANATDALKVYLYAGGWGKGGEVLYDDVKLFSIKSGLWQIVMKGNNTYQLPEVVTKRIDNTKYQVEVSASQPFFLVFSESYDSYWKAYVNTDGGETNWVKALFMKPLPEDKHLMVNGYANAWYIDPEELGMADKEFNITLYYQPQSWFYLGMTISGLTILGSIAYLIWIYFLSNLQDTSLRTKHLNKSTVDNFAAKKQASGSIRWISRWEDSN